MSYLFIKALHVIFIVTWFAGLFYVPRLFVYHVETESDAVRLQLGVMERRLLVITHIGGGLAVLFGIFTLALAPALLHQPWLHAKLSLVVLLIAYHLYLVRLKNQLARGTCTRTSRWLRMFNEIPSVLLIAIVLLVVLKPGI